MADEYYSGAYTGAEIDAGIAAANAAAPQATTYSKTEVDGLLATKQNAITTLTDSGTMTNATTISDTGVGVDIPADGGIWEVSGCITWRGSTPTEAQLRVNFGVRTSSYLMARSTNANDDSKNFVYLPVSCTFKADAYYPEDADKTVHIRVWGKTSAATGNCDVMIIARKIG